MGWIKKGKKVHTNLEKCDMIKVSKDNISEDNMLELQRKLFLLEQEYKLCEEARKKLLALKIARVKHTIYLKSL